MMLPTHVLASIFIFSISPVFGSVIFLGLLVFGSVFPDFDLFLDHRRSLHFPVLYSVLATIFFVFDRYLFVAFFLGAAVHCLMDFLGNDAGQFVDEDRGAVFNHLQHEWLEGRNLIGIDGDSRDLFLAFCLLIGVFIFGDLFSKILASGIFVLGLVYWSIRDRVGEIFPDFLLE